MRLWKLIQNKLNYRTGFYFLLFLLLIVMTVCNYLYNFRNSKTTLSNINEKEILNSLYFCQKITGNFFPLEKIRNIKTNEFDLTKFIDETIIILLSNSGCNPCQIRELKYLQKLNEEYKDKVTVKAIYIGKNELDILRIKKVTQTSFDFFQTDGLKLSSLQNLSHFPMIFFISGQRILYSYLPIPGNDDFSIWSVENIENLLNVDK